MTREKPTNVNRHAVYGSATVEAVIAMLALIPALTAVVYLGRERDIQAAAVAGTRYLSWERTVWRESGGGAVKSDTVLQREMRDRIQGSDRGGLLASTKLDELGIAVNPTWRDVGGERLLDGTDESRGISAITSTSTKSVSGDTGPVLRMVAFGDAVPGIVETIGLADDMLGLQRDRIRVNSVRTSVRARLEEQGPLTLAGRKPSDTAPPIIFDLSSGMLGDDWRAPNEEVYEHRTQRLVGSKPVATISAVAPMLGNFPIFKEGKYANNTDFVPATGVNLPDYEKPDDG